MVRVELNCRKIGLCHSCPCFALKFVYSPSFSALVSSHRKWYLSNSLADFRSFSEMGGTGGQRRGRSQGIFALHSAPGSTSFNNCFSSSSLLAAPVSLFPAPTREAVPASSDGPGSWVQQPTGVSRLLWWLLPWAASLAHVWLGFSYHLCTQSPF